MRTLIVTGTGTSVGKTVVTAALASCAQQAGQRVAVVKPIQTGVQPGEPGDLADVQRLTGLADVHEYVRYLEPLAPASAAARLGESGPDIASLSEAIAGLVDRDLVIVEGAGGAAVWFNTGGEGLCDLGADLGDALRRAAVDRALPEPSPVETVLVTAAGLGCLHDAAVTTELLDRWALGPLHLVIGDWPDDPGLAERCNLLDLPLYTGAAIGGVLAHGSGTLGSAEFAAVAVRSLTPALGGSFDAPEFIRRNSAPLPTREASS